MYNNDMNHNVLLICALVTFVFIVLRVYFIFLLSTKQKEPEELTLGEALNRAQQLFDDNMHIELQRFLKRELAKKYKSLELRKLLIRSYLALDNTSLAALHLEAVLKIDSTDIDAKQQLGRIYLDDGQKSKALAVYEDLYNYDPTDIMTIKNLAQLYRDLGYNSKSAQMFTLMLEAEDNPDEIVSIKHTIAQLLLADGDNQGALSTYNEILELTPNDLVVIETISELAYKQSDWDKCLECYDKISKIKGEDVEILEKIAKMHFNVQHWDEALIAYRKLIDLEGSQSINYLHYQNQYCETLIHKEMAQEAIDILTNLIKDFPEEDSLAYTLAQAYVSVKEYDEAVQLYLDLIEKLPPEQTEILQNYLSSIIASWAMDLFNSGEYNKAFDKFFEALKYNQESAEIYFKLAKCNCDIKSFQDAISHFKRAIAIAPQESKYYFGLGFAFDELGDVKSARSAFLDAININPLDVRSRKGYAIALTKEFEYAKAVEQFIEILKYEPNDADTYYNLALAHEILGDFDNARKNYEVAISIEPEHVEALHNLELLNS